MDALVYFTPTKECSAQVSLNLLDKNTFVPLSLGFHVLRYRKNCQTGLLGFFIYFASRYNSYNKYISISK